MAGLTLVAALAIHAPAGCVFPSGWEDIERKSPKFVVFGEVHGTRESPQLVGSIACALANGGAQILVAVELDSSSNPHLQRLWKRPVRGFAQHVLNDLPFFAERRDGVASTAMLDLLVKLHALARKGMRIDVVAFNGASSDAQRERWKALPGQGPHEAAQAENIAQASALKRYKLTLILVGNIHARRSPIDAEASFETMAMKLAQKGNLLSLNQIFGSGTMWNCIGRPTGISKPGVPTNNLTIDCDNHQTAGSPDRPAKPIGLWVERRSGPDADYDGYYWFDIVHGSAPARTSKDATLRHR